MQPSLVSKSVLLSLIQSYGKKHGTLPHRCCNFVPRAVVSALSSFQQKSLANDNAACGLGWICMTCANGGISPATVQRTLQNLARVHLQACRCRPCCDHLLWVTRNVLQGLVASMQSSPSLSQQQMSQIISAGSFSHKQAQLQPNTIPLSHGKVRLATTCYAYQADVQCVPCPEDAPGQHIS